MKRRDAIFFSTWFHCGGLFTAKVFLICVINWLNSVLRVIEGEVLLGTIAVVINSAGIVFVAHLLRDWRDFVNDPDAQSLVAEIKRRSKLMSIPEAELVNVYDHVARNLVEIFNKHAEMPHLFLGVQLNKTAPHGFHIIFEIPPRVAAFYYRDDAAKGTIPLLVSALLREDSPVRADMVHKSAPLPDLIVQISEIWMIRKTVPRGTVFDLNDAPRPSQDPERCEGLAIVVHSLTQSVMGTCPIHATPTRHAEYAPAMTEADGWETDGRMAMQDAAITKH